MERKISVSMIKGIATMTCTVIGNELEMISPALILLLLLMITDYISGMLASKKEAVEHPNSKKSIIGIYKKAGYIVTILAAISTDYILYALLGEMGIAYQTKTFFGFLVTIWLTLNELLSILENAGRLGVALPQFLMSILVEMKKDVDEHGTK